jgi:hypothetical protein
MGDAYLQQPHLTTECNQAVVYLIWQNHAPVFHLRYRLGIHQRSQCAAICIEWLLDSNCVWGHRSHSSVTTIEGVQ